MNISELCIRRPVFASVFSMMLVIFGVVALERLALREYPDISRPVVSISTTYRGASASVVENKVTQAIEDRVAGIEGILKLESDSEEERSSIRIEFDSDRDIDAAALGPVLDKVFGGLPAKSELQQVSQSTLASVGRRIVVDLDVPQAVLSFGGTGLLRKDPDFIPAFVVNHILGGGSFSSRLYNEVREKRGLAYGVYSYLSPMEYSGLFSGNTQTRADGAKEALEVIESEIARMRNDGPSADELAKAKSYLKGSYALNFDTSSKISAQLLRIQLDEVGIDYINRRNGLIDAVTLADAKRVARRLADGGLFVTVVGKPKGLASKEPGG